MVALAVNVICLSVMSVLLDLVCSEGESKRYVKVAYNLTVVAVLAGSVLNILKTVFPTYTTVTESSSNIAVNQEVLSAIYDDKARFMENYCENLLACNNYPKATISIEYNTTKNGEITRVEVCGVSDNAQKTEVATVLVSALSVPREVIVFV